MHSGDAQPEPATGANRYPDHSLAARGDSNGRGQDLQRQVVVLVLALYGRDELGVARVLDPELVLT